MTTVEWSSKLRNRVGEEGQGGGEEREARMVSIATGKQNHDDPVEGKGNCGLVLKRTKIQRAIA